MPSRAATAMLFLFALAALAGCGQTGPLYMPGEAPSTEQPALPAGGEQTVEDD